MDLVCTFVTLDNQLFQNFASELLPQNHVNILCFIFRGNNNPTIWAGKISATLNLGQIQFTYQHLFSFSSFLSQSLRQLLIPHTSESERSITTLLICREYTRIALVMHACSEIVQNFQITDEKRSNHSSSLNSFLSVKLKSTRLSSLHATFYVQIGLDQAKSISKNFFTSKLT